MALQSWRGRFLLCCVFATEYLSVAVLWDHEMIQVGKLKSCCQVGNAAKLIQASEISLMTFAKWIRLLIPLVDLG